MGSDPTMRLLEAFRTFGPEPAVPDAASASRSESPEPARREEQVDQVVKLIPDAEKAPVALTEKLRLESRLIQEAAELINERLAVAEKRLRNTFRPDVLEEARGDLALKLLLNGPRGTIEGEPDTDEGVEGWLYESLKNRALDRIKSKFRRELTGQEILESVGGASGPHDSVHGFDEKLASRSWEMQSSAETHDAVDTLIRSEQLGHIEALVPLAKQTILEETSEPDKASLGELFALFEETVTFKEVVARAGEDTRKTRNRIYKRHERALDRASRHIVVLLLSGRIGHQVYDVCTALLRNMVRRSQASADSESKS